MIHLLLHQLVFAKARKKIRCWLPPFFPLSLTLMCNMLLFQCERGLTREGDLSFNNLVLIFCYLGYRLV